MSKVETATLGSGVAQRVDVSLNESISTGPNEGDANACVADDAGSGGRAPSAAVEG